MDTQLPMAIISVAIWPIFMGPQILWHQVLGHGPQVHWI